MRPLLLTLLQSIVLLCLPNLLWAQGQLPDVAPLGAAPQPQNQQAGPPPDAPETHAAAGGAETTLPQGNEPTLPSSPTEMSDKVKEMIGSDGAKLPIDSTFGVERNFYGLYYQEQALNYEYRVAFPLWGERKMPSLRDPTQVDRASIYGGLYYNRRAANHADDIFFPVFWNLRNPLDKARTTIVGPFVNRRTPVESDDWLLPFYAVGTRENQGSYQLIPPLLTYRQTDGSSGFNLIGPAYCSWEGGRVCDTRSAHNISWGLVPLYFFSQNEKHQQEIIPPLLHYYRYDSRRLSWTNIYGPYFRAHNEKRESLHLMPIYWSIWGKNERHTTVAPLFHYGYQGDDNLLITPLFYNRINAKKGNTFVSLPYARHRGARELDMITPLYWDFRDPRIGQKGKLILPFL
ncbi:MAG: hypothetical protein MK135_17745, partial [Polyangiaceae bacterium]|nr:hypothetical protein [Polyangiaceae bacterium]